MNNNIKVKIENVYFRYHEDNNYIFRNLNLEIYNGEKIALIGNNGSGKTTLSFLLNGILLPDKGKVLIDGLDTKDINKNKIIKRKVGYIFQNPESQIVAPTVERELAFGLQNLNLPINIIREKVNNYLNDFNLADYRYKNPYELSGGEKHRLAIASILIMEPDFIIFDEPTTGLDRLSQQELDNFITTIRNNPNITYIIITHYYKILNYVDKVIYLDKGKINFNGSVNEFIVYALEKKLVYFPSWMNLQKKMYKDLCNNIDLEIFLDRIRKDDTTNKI